MSISYIDKVEDIKQERSDLLNSKASAIQDIAEMQEIENFNESYLFNEEYNSSNLDKAGIQDLFLEYYKEKTIERNNSYSSPSLANYTKSYWNSSINTAIAGIDNLINNGQTNNFYRNSNGDIVVYFGSNWLGENGENEGTNFITLFKNNYIGSSYTGSSYTSETTYSTSSAAITAGKSYLNSASNRGSGLRKYWGSQNEVTSSGIIGNYTYQIGTGYIYIYGNYDGYSSSERTSFLNAFDVLINTTIPNYILQLNKLKTIIGYIEDDTNVIFGGDSNMKQDVLDSSSEIQDLITNLETWLGDSGDGVADSTLWGYRNYFNSLSQGDVTGNGNLTNLETLLNTMSSAINTRYTNVENYLGTYGSTIGSFSNLRKWRTFWLNEKLNLDSGSMVSIYNSNETISEVNSLMLNMDRKVAALFGDTSSWENRDKYIPTEIVLAAYYDPLIDRVTGITTLKRIGLVWSGQQHATKYEIYRREINSVPLNNEQWIDDTPILTIEETNEGFVLTETRDTNVDTNYTYGYRIKTIDSFNDPNIAESKSLQSNIYNPDISFSFTEIQKGVINFTEEHPFKKRQFILITNSDEDINGFYRIIDTGETSIVIEGLVSTFTDGVVYPAPGIATTKPFSGVLPSPSDTPSPTPTPEPDDNEVVVIDNRYILRNGTLPLTSNWNAGNFDITVRGIYATSIETTNFTTSTFNANILNANSVEASLGNIDELESNNSTINNLNINNEYSFPNTDGNLNQVLKTDGNGNLTWQDEFGGGGGTGSSVTEYTIHASYTSTDFPIGTPVAVFEGFAVPASKSDSTKIAVTGLVSEVKDTSIVVSQKIALLENINSSVIPTIELGEPLFVGDNGTLIQDTELIVNGDFRILVGYGYSTNSIDIQIGEPVQIGDLPDDGYWDSVPLGGIIFNSTGVVKTGYLPTDGRELSRTDYAELNSLYFAAGYPYGDGDGSSTFNIPYYEDQMLIVKVRNVASLTVSETANIDSRLASIETGSNGDFNIAGDLSIKGVQGRTLVNVEKIVENANASTTGDTLVNLGTPCVYTPLFADSIVIADVTYSVHLNQTGGDNDAEGKIYARCVNSNGTTQLKLLGNGDTSSHTIGIANAGVDPYVMNIFSITDECVRGDDGKIRVRAYGARRPDDAPGYACELILRWQSVLFTEYR